MKQLITSESVTEGHPDKMCDQISDAILDACFEQDINARVACETFLCNDTLILGGELRTTATLDHEQIARDTIVSIGFDSDEKYFDGKTCKITNLLHTQSPDIAQGVDTGGAGDQGIMFGYATNETDDFLPSPISLAHKLSRKLAQVRKDHELDYLYPDGKTQVTVEYQDGKPVRVDTIVLSTQHAKNVDQSQLHTDVKNKIINPIVGELIDDETKYHINPTGVFNIGGPYGDTGLTGRKIIVDTYGGIGRHGGGAFSGKDPTKVDRSAAYMARYIAKNIVAAGLCERCEVQLGYAIGVAEPVSLYIDDFGTGERDLATLEQYVRKAVDLTPNGIITHLNLRRPIYQQTACYGHFGRKEFSREKLDLIEKLV